MKENASFESIHSVVSLNYLHFLSASTFFFPGIWSPRSRLRVLRALVFLRLVGLSWDFLSVRGYLAWGCQFYTKACKFFLSWQSWYLIYLWRHYYYYYFYFIIIIIIITFSTTCVLMPQYWLQGLFETKLLFEA